MVPGTDLKLGNSPSSFIRICVLRCLKESQVDIYVRLVLIKNTAKKTMAVVFMPSLHNLDLALFLHCTGLD